MHKSVLHSFDTMHNLLSRVNDTTVSCRSIAAEQQELHSRKALADTDPSRTAWTSFRLQTMQVSAQDEG